MSIATAEGTARYRRRHAIHLPERNYRTLGQTQCLVSLIGFGSYRVDHSVAYHRAALQRALQRGCNLIDTSTNYADGESERLIGQVLKSEIEAKRLARDEFVVVSKAGYVQGSNLEKVQAREGSGNPYPEMVKYMDGCWHCIHPSFIADQLTGTLERLQLAAVDVYLLHNPEYYFADHVQRGDTTPLPDVRREFYRRIENAFVHLENEVKAGRIGSYGVSSNTFVESPSDPEMTSLTEMCARAAAAAKTVWGDTQKHHFRVVQFPGNLFESKGFTLTNNGHDGKQTVLEYAAAQGLGVLINRPLNAIVENHLIRLADFKIEPMPLSLADQALIVARLEKEFNQRIAPTIQSAEGGLPATEFFKWGAELSAADLESIGLEQWHQIQSQVITPQIRNVVFQLNDFLVGNLKATWDTWRDQYLHEMQKLLRTIENDCAKRSQKMSDTIHRKLNPLIPPIVARSPLSQKALAVLANTPGVTSVLNGMRHAEYVMDSMGVGEIEPFTVDKTLYENFSLA